MPISARAASCLALGLLAACARPPAAAPVAAPPRPETQAVDPGPSSFEGEIGGLSEDDVAEAFAALLPPVQRCLEEGSARIDRMGGQFKLSLRIGRRGEARSAYLAHSTLGDRDTEKCVIDLAKSRAWPKPLSGDGLAEQTFEMSPREAPIEWTEGRVRAAAARARSDTASCRKGIAGRFLATAYVDAAGHVVSAGVSPPNAKGEEAADCVVAAVKRLRFGSPGARAAKVSFEIR